MGNRKTSELTPATVLTGVEEIPVTQGGVSRAATVQQILAVSLPASPAGLPDGAVWNDNGVVRAVESVPSVNDFSNANPMYISHRGSYLLFPELTEIGADAAYAAGSRSFDFDLHKLSDNTLVVMHDLTVDRTTTSTGNISALNTAGWQALSIDQDAYTGSVNWSNTLKPPFWGPMLALFSGKTTMTIQVDANDMADVVATLIAAGTPKTSVILQNASVGELAIAVAAGFPALILATGTGSIAAAQAAGITWVGLNIATESNATIQAWVAAGFKVAIYTVNYRWERDAMLALGVTAIWTDDITYISTNAPSRTSDNFGTGRWSPGMIGWGGPETNFRGKLYASGHWGFDVSAAQNHTLQGWACPIKGLASANNYVIDLAIRFDSANGGDATRFASMFTSNTDLRFNDGSSPFSAALQGNSFLFRKNGQIQIYKRDAVATTQLATGNSVAIADGETVRYRVTVTPTLLKLDRLNTAGVVTHTVSSSDTTVPRGGYFHLGNASLGCRFRVLSIT